ncbi:MAG: response regulator [Planctomycetia bacterium]|nr:response regulator [Planctomycetia bacterium]
MFKSIRARFITLFAALVLAPIALLSALTSFATRNLADESLAEYEKSLTDRTRSEITESVRELARLEDRTLGAFERRAAAMAGQAAQIFRARASLPAERPAWIREGYRPDFVGWLANSQSRSSLWIPRMKDGPSFDTDLDVFAGVERILANEPRGEGMTQWYAIHRSGMALLVPGPPDIPIDESFDPRSGIFYEPATPARNPSGGVVWTQVYNDPVGKGVMISCLAPIGGDAEFEGIIGIDLSAEDFRVELEQAGGQWDYAFLLDGRGAVLLVSPAGYPDFGVSAPGGIVEKALEWKVDGIPDLRLREACLRLGHRDQGLETVSFGGRDRLIAHRRLQSTGWILGLVASPDRFLQPARAMRATQESLHRRYLLFILTFIAILLSSCFLFAWFLGRTVTRPLRRLSDAARAIGAGGPESQIAPDSPDEIGTLAVTLRQMVHDREEAQRSIAENQKLAALGGMASGICHELNNLLAPILGFAQVLGRGPLTPDQRAQVDRVEKAARAAREVVGSLLDSTHELAGMRQPTDLNAVAREAVAQLEAARARAEVEVQWDLDPSLPAVSANPSIVQRAFFNIADNAIQAMAPCGRGRRLTVRSRLVHGTEAPARAKDDLPRPSGARIQVVFEDEGPGVPPDLLNRIFDPFFTTKPPGSGTGLGLSVATSCIRSHSGSIRAENRPGGGAKFTVSLPVAQSPAPRRAPLTPPPREVALPPARPRILVVDDEDSIRILVTHALREDNEVTACDGGRTAIEMLQSREFDAVVCDLRLRDVTGRQVYTWIRANRPALSRRFLVMTGDTHGDEGRTFLEDFQTPCVTKPFDLDELRQRVRELLRGRA